jgi:class 3 adenylate cyclase
MFDSIVPAIEDYIAEEWSSTTPVVAVLLVLGLFVEIISFLKLQAIEAHIKSVLRMLLYIPQDVVATTAKITQVLAGDFSPAKSDGGAHGARFFDEVFANLPDAIVYADENHQIRGANLAAMALFGTEEMVGAQLSDFYNGDRFRGDVASLWVPPPTSVTLAVRVDGSDVFYEVCTQTSNELLVLSAQDVTQTMRYNTLIAEERSKSDEMLASILPASLVKRVQDGEKNISFAVQTASISFIDIVEFTPWCGSLPAAVVMSTLNAMYKKFDECVANRATLTKIKCIGDCYVSAGGIFSEINQPAVHAKDMLSFGLDAIQSIEELNQEVGQQLRARVGMNTGGPIVAGVLGIGKPTFEILGPTINMAQQMEHHGVPMQVHISRAVYELVYGDPTFQVKERGATQINAGTVITYLVSPKK